MAKKDFIRTTAPDGKQCWGVEMIFDDAQKLQLEMLAKEFDCSVGELFGLAVIALCAKKNKHTLKGVLDRLRAYN